MEMPSGSFLQPTRASHEVDTVYLPTVPIVTKLTAGLKLLYKRIKDGTILPQGQTDLNGKFIPTRNVFIAGRYSIQCCIATKSQTAVLIKAKDSYQENQLAIIKVVHLTFLSSGLKEVFTLRRLNSSDPSQGSHTVRLLNSFIHQGHICLVFPCYDSRPVTDVLTETCLSEQKLCSALRKISRQLLTALAFLRHKEIIHADVKPDNILVEEGSDLDTITLIDFGNSLKPTQTSLYYSDFEIQTLPYRAPEVHLGIPFGIEIDMWSVGCVLFECYTGQVLFNGLDRQEILNKIISVLGPPPVEMCTNAKFSSDIKPLCGQHKSGALGLMTVFTKKKNYQFASFLSGMLTFDPEKRMTPWDALQHPFMSAELSIPFYLGDLSTCPNGVVHEKDYEFKPALSGAVVKCGLPTLGMLKPRTFLKPLSTKKEKITSIAQNSPSNIKRELDKSHLCKPLQDQTPCKPLQDQTPCKPLQDQTPCKLLQDQTLFKPLKDHTPYKSSDHNCNTTHEVINKSTVHIKSLTPEKSEFGSEEKCRKWLQNFSESSLPHIGLSLGLGTTCTTPVGVFTQLDKSTCKETKSTLDTHDTSGPLFKDSSQRKVMGKRSEAKKYQVSVSKSLLSESDSECRQKQSVLYNSPMACKEYRNESQSRLEKSPIAQSGSRKESHSPMDKSVINEFKSISPAAMVETHITQKECKNKRLLPDMNNSKSSHFMPNWPFRKRVPDDSLRHKSRSLSIKKIKMVNPSSNYSLLDSVVDSNCLSEDGLEEADQYNGESSNSSSSDGHNTKVGNNHNLNLTYTMQHTMMETSLNNECLMNVLKKKPVSPKRNIARPHGLARPPNKQVSRSHSYREKINSGETDAEVVHEKNLTYSKCNIYNNSCTFPFTVNHHKSKAETQENIQKGQVTISSPTLSSSFNLATNSRNVVAMLHSNAGAMLQCNSDCNVSLRGTRSSLPSINVSKTSSDCTSHSMKGATSPGNNGHLSGSEFEEATSTSYNLPSKGMIFTESTVVKCATTVSSGLARNRRVGLKENRHNNSSIQNNSIELSYGDTGPSCKRIKSPQQVSCASMSMASVRSSDQVQAFQHLTPDCQDDSRTSSSTSESESGDVHNSSHLPKKTEKIKMDRLGLVDEKSVQLKRGLLLASKREAQSLDFDTTYTVTKGRLPPCTKHIRSHNKSINVQTYSKSPDQKVSNHGPAKLPVVNSLAVSKPLQNQKLCNESYRIVQRESRKTSPRQTVKNDHMENREVAKKHLTIADTHSNKSPQNSYLDTVTVDRIEEAYSGTADNTILTDMFESTVEGDNNNGPSSDLDETFDETSSRHSVEDVSLLIS